MAYVAESVARRLRITTKRSKGCILRCCPQMRTLNDITAGADILDTAVLELIVDQEAEGLGVFRRAILRGRFSEVRPIRSNFLT